MWTCRRSTRNCSPRSARIRTACLRRCRGRHGDRPHRACAVANVEREGINYRIEMKVPGTRVVHVLRMPTPRRCRTTSGLRPVWSRRGGPSRRVRSWSRSGALYDKVHISHDGYAGAVPIVHKSAAVSEVIAQLAIEADEDSNSRARDWPEEPGVRFLIRSVLHQGGLCGPTKSVPTASSAAADAATRADGVGRLPACVRTGRRSTSPRTRCPRTARRSDGHSNALLVRRCFAFSMTKSIGLAITLQTSRRSSGAGTDRSRAPGAGEG